MTTLYPASIDGYSQIRVARDRIDEIVAADHNDVRSAVIAIEQTLGINPQGPFGTVVERLNDAYSNIEYHVRGLPPRHLDTVIESPAKSGSHYNLSIGNVGSQLQGLLDIVNSLDYDGSGSRTFADGYALPSSSLVGAISEIVGQIGRTTGGTKVGETSYTTSKYSFTGSSVHAQLRNVEDYITETSTMLERAFDSFVVSGMAVSQYGSGPNAVITSGYIASNGRHLRYNGAIIVISTPGDYYIYAKITSGAVVVSATTSLSSIVDPVSPVVLLHKFTTAGGAWSSSVDLRRYGSFINDKNYLTVGNTPATGSDGYGCDFESLKSAIEYVKTINSYATKVIAPKRIILVSDITISSTSEASILIDTTGIEIDGAGRKITVSVDAPVFVIMSSYTHIHDLNVEFSLVSAASSACLANIATIFPPAVTLYGIQIENCTITASGSYSAAYFVKVGRAAITDDNLIRDSIFANNIALVSKAGIGFSNTTTISAYVLANSIISGNKFYQGTFAVSSEPCLRASSSCMVVNNTIQGGFDVGLSIDNGLSCIVCGNNIVGGTTTALMNQGIKLSNSYATIMDTVVSGNTIINVATRGIYASNTLGLIISNNVIDNSDLTTLATSMVGIYGSGTDDWVIGNRIIVPGSYGIRECKYVINNYILGSVSVTGTTSAISMSGSSNGIISGNAIESVAGRGIDGNTSSNLVICGNFLLGAANSSDGIIFAGKDSIISNNIINAYCQSAVSSAIVTSIGGINTLIIGNQVINPTSNMNSGVYLYDNRAVIVNNIFGDTTVGMPKLGIAVNNKADCIISNNMFFGQGSGTAFYYTISEIGNNCIVSSNYIKNSNESAIDINGTNVVCSCNRIIDAHDYSIYCYDASEPFIYDNIINGSGNDAIYIYNTQYPIIKNNSIFDSYGAGVVATYHSHYAIIDGNFISNLGTGEIAISVDQVHSPSITSNYTTGTYECVSATIDAYNVLVANNYSYHDSNGIFVGWNVPTDSLIVNNYLIFNTLNAAGVGVFGGKVSICNNFIYSGGGPGIQLSINTPDCLISGNYIENTSSTWTALIVNGGCHNTVISGNKLKNIGRNGIKLFTGLPGGSDNVIVCNNYLDTVAEQGIALVGDCNYCSIYGNYLKDVTLESIAIYANSLGYSWGNQIFGNFLYNYVASTVTSSILVLGSVTYGTNDHTTIFGNYLLNNHVGAGGMGGINVSYSDGSIIDNNWLFFVDGTGIGLSNSINSKISNNYVYYPDSGSGGILLNSTTSKCLVSDNFIFGPIDCHGIMILGYPYVSVVGNYISGVSYDFSGIYLSAACTKTMANDNFVTTFAGTYAFDFRSVDSSSFVGNMCVDPASGSNGMGLQGCDDTLVVGNYCYGGSGTGSTGFVIDSPTPNITATGNLARGNTTPTSFGAGNAIDAADCRYVA